MVQRKSILTNSLWGVALVLLFCIAGCTPEKEYPPLEFRDFTAELTSFTEKGLNGSDLQKLRKKHGRFFDLWLYEIVDFTRFGPLNDSAQAAILSDFLLRNKPVLPSVVAHFKKYEGLQQQISNAFGKLGEILGGVQKPVVYSYFSQFSNYNTFIDTNLGRTYLAFSSEMFMNDTFQLYKLPALEIPDFFMRYCGTDQIAPMLVWNYLQARFEEENQAKNMLEEAVFNGKIWYTMEAVFGPDNLYRNLGYTEKEWDMMLKDEGQIWRHYLNEEALFSTDFKEYRRYFIYGNRTFGSGIPEDCPPLIGNFSGYRIVKAYMEKKDESLKKLWSFKDATSILRMSAYNPIK